jgi:hypothetical protein
MKYGRNTNKFLPYTFIVCRPSERSPRLRDAVPRSLDLTPPTVVMIARGFRDEPMGHGSLQNATIIRLISDVAKR